MSAECWWEDEMEDGETEESAAERRADALLSETEELENEQKDWHSTTLLASRMFYNRDLPAFDWGAGLEYPALAPVEFETENLLTLVGRVHMNIVGKNRPKPSAQTDGGSWKLRREAKKLDKAIYAEFMRNGVYELGKTAFQDAFVSGLGAIRVDWVDDHIEFARVFPDNIIVNHRECSDEPTPVTVRIRKAVPRDYLEHKYGVEFDDDDEPSYTTYRSLGKDYEILVEAWRRPYAGDPGRHVVACRGQLLVDEPWDHDWFPIVFFHWDRPPSGFYCAPGLEQAIPYQLEQNKANRVKRESHNLFLRAKLLVPEGSNVHAAQLNNEIGGVVSYRPPFKPEVANWPALTPEFYQHYYSIKDRCLAAYSISQMAAQAQLPAGTRLDSSKAMQEYNYIQDDQYADLAQRWERFYVQLAETFMRVMGEVGNKDRVATFLGAGKVAEYIDWSAIDLDSHKYVFSIQPTSVFSMSHAARLDFLERMLSQGVITPTQYIRYMGNVDIPGLSSLQSRIEEDVEYVLEMLESAEDPDDFIPPDGFQALDLAIPAIQSNYLHLKWLKDVPQWVLDNHVRWIGLAQAVVDQVTAPEAQAAPAGMEDMAAAGVPQPGMSPEQTGMPAEVDIDQEVGAALEAYGGQPAGIPGGAPVV